MAVTSNFSESDRVNKGMLLRAVIASTVGTSIEWYDFFLYSTVTGLVFAKEFFPNSDPLVGTLQAFLIYAVGFIARPIGAAIFGHYGDRIGRKAALVATLLLMGIATVLVGFVPGYSRIGIWGAVILTILRFIQGVGVGGEWGGSVLLAMEWSKSHGNRGFIAAWPQFGVPAGLFLANLAVIVFNIISGDKFLDWGWRVPFILSAILIVIGLWIRLGILETPVFSKLVIENKIEKAPALEVIKRQPTIDRLVVIDSAGGTDSILYFHRIRLFLWNGFPESGPRAPAQRRPPVCRARAFHNTFVWIHFGSHRTEANLFAGRGADGSQWIYLLRITRYAQPQPDRSRNSIRSNSPFHSLRDPGFFDCRTIHPAFAVQWSFDWLSVRFNHRRRSGTTNSRLAFLRVQDGLIGR